MKKRRRTNKGKKYELTLRPWREVARLFNERSGEHISGPCAASLHTRAIRKIQKAFAAMEAA